MSFEATAILAEDARTTANNIAQAYEEFRSRGGNVVTHYVLNLVVNNHGDPRQHLVLLAEFAGPDTEPASQA